jgi:UDP-N-acetylglucosamine 2-epimerase (hydrolysing)
MTYTGNGTKKKILFITGTRADYGKLKSLMLRVQRHPAMELQLFVTGMHMLSQYGSTYREIEKDGFINLYKFMNQRMNQPMDITLSNTILGLGIYIAENRPDLIVVHGDRVEALAAAIVGALNNIRVAHIEGGEVSGTIDESIRHAITKFAHIHLVSNYEAKKRVMQLGEKENTIFVLGSPDIDIMYSKNLPSIDEVKAHYEINFKRYAILMYHPVVTELDKLRSNIRSVVDAILASDDNYVVIYPNNDEGSQVILDEYARIKGKQNIRLFPSIRFEYFLTLMKNAEYLIGNSSAGVREAEVYGIPSIDIGTRQSGRYDRTRSKNIIHTDEDVGHILNAIKVAKNMRTEPQSTFGNGKSDETFIKLLESHEIWETEIQKRFISYENLM